MAAAATVSQTDKAAATDLKFTTATGTGAVTAVGGLTLGGGFTGSQVRYTGVSTGIDALITATPFTGAAPGGTGTDYTFNGHITNYRTTGIAEPNDDTGLLYQIAPNGTGKGGLTYRIQLFDTGTTTAITPANFRFLVYDVDGEPSQNEAVRIAKNSGLSSYQLGGVAASALTFSEDANSYLFTGRGADQPENNSNGAAIFNFDGVSEVTFQFEANTTTANASANRIFSAIDGDLSYLSSFTNGGAASFGSVVSTASATDVPEPFTIIGTLIGGTAAFRMRKKLKADKASIG